MPRVFVLDQNFPHMVLTPRLPEVELRALSSVDPWLTSNVEDWAILVALHQLRPEVHGFVTCDERMLLIPRVLAVLLQTNLTVVVCGQVGHDPVLATGLLLLHLPAISRNWRPEPQLWVLRYAQKLEDDVQEHVARLARRRRVAAGQLRRESGLAEEQLREPIKRWYGLQPLIRGEK